MIDLNQCVFGDKLRLRSGEIAIYIRSTGMDGGFPHGIARAGGGDCTRSDDGRAFYEPSEGDVVEILGQEGET